MRLDVKQLRYFVAVAEELHFGRAAARLHIVQPALSMQIKALEENLGTQLLTRTRQNVALTAAGEAFLGEARRAVEQVERAEAVGRRAAGGEIGRMSIGYVSSAPFSGFMSRSISAFRQSYPHVEMRLEEMFMEEQVRRLQDGTLDVGFVRLPLASVSGLTVTKLARERIVLALPTSHPLAAQKTVKPADLRDEGFILVSGQANTGLITLVWRICDQGGFTPSVTQTTSQVTTAVSLVAAGLGVALVPESLTAMQLGTVTYRHLSGVTDVSEIALLTGKHPVSPMTQNFVRLVATKKFG